VKTEVGANLKEVIRKKFKRWIHLSKKRTKMKAAGHRLLYQTRRRRRGRGIEV